MLDKGHEEGGRVCTHGTEDGLSFDHGAQYLTIRDRWFRRMLAPLIEGGTLVRWTGRLAVAGPDGVRPLSDGEERWIATPTMSALPRALAEGLTVDTSVRVTGMRREGSRWSLEHEHGLYDGFDRVVLAIPAGQAAELMREHPGLAGLRSAAEAVVMEPCWTLMLYMPGVFPTGYDAAFVEGSPLSWAMRQSSKAGRPSYEAWVLHATATWTRAHWDDHHLDVTEAMLEAWHERGGPSPRAVSQTMAHRWRQAGVDPHARPRSLGDDEAGVALAGDWLGGGRVEGAFLSGRKAAAGVLRSLR